MKHLAALLLALGACYSPTYDSCVYTCAADGSCPGSLSCVEGMCSTGGACGAVTDGGADTILPDGSPLDVRCSNGISDPGEFCPTRLEDVPIDGTYVALHHAQMANAGNAQYADLIVLGTTATTSNLLRYPGTPTGFALLNGPYAVDYKATALTSSTHVNPPLATLYTAGDSGASSLSESGGVLASISSQPHGVAGTPTAVAFGNFTPETSPVTPTQLAVAYPTKVAVVRIDDSGRLGAPVLAQNPTVSGIRGVAQLVRSASALDVLLVATGNQLVAFEYLQGMFGLMAIAAVQGISQMAVGEIDRDGSADILLTTATDAVQVSRWVGEDFETAEPYMAVPGLTGPIALDDLDGDDRDDVIVARRIGSAHALVVRLGFSEGQNPTTPIEVPIPYPADHIHVGDVNRDGVPDIIVTSSTAMKVTFIIQTP